MSTRVFRETARRVPAVMLKGREEDSETYTNKYGASMERINNKMLLVIKDSCVFLDTPKKNICTLVTVRVPDAVCHVIRDPAQSDDISALEFKVYSLISVYFCCFLYSCS